MNAPPRPPVTVDLEWRGDLRFEARAGDHAVTLDGDSAAGLSPVQALASALAGCMAVDIVHILAKARLAPGGLRARLAGRRAETDPRRLVKVDLHFVVQGAVPPDRVEHAITLSRQTYCSVWHSLRPDIEFATTFEITP